MNSHSARLLAAGVVVLVVGVLLTLLAVQGASSDDQPLAPLAQAGESGSEDDVDPDAFQVPAGSEAVAVQLPFDAGVAALPRAGDVVNAYGVFTRGRPGDLDDGPEVRLVLSNVKILAAPGVQPGATGGSTTYVLEVTADQAEQLIFLHAAEGVWLSLVPPDAPAPTTTGRDHGSILQ